MLKYNYIIVNSNGGKQMKKQNRNHANRLGCNHHHPTHPSRHNPKTNQWRRRHHHPSALGRICHRI